MQLLRSPLFIVCALLFLVHQVLQKVLHIYFTPIDRYLDALLAMPIILTLLLAERRLLFKRGKTYRLSAITVILATIYVSVVAEWIFPHFSTKFTADWLDVLMYAAGSGIFYWLGNKAA